MFNYADSGTKAGSSPALFWLARRHKKPGLAAFEKQLLANHFSRLKSAGEKTVAPRSEKLNRQELLLGNLPDADLVYSNRFYALEIVWYPTGATEAAAPDTRRPALYRGATDVAFLSDKNSGVFVGLKGAGMPNNHAHLDAGSFVLDTPGVRWAADLGGDNYDLPGYFNMRENGKRWGYFRLGSPSHNVVTINGKNQRTPCRAPMSHFFADEKQNGAVVELSDAYREQAASVRRGVMVRSDCVRVQDEIVATKDGDEARWALMTRAKIEVRGSVARLTRAGKTMRARLVSPAGAEWRIESARPPTAVEKQNKGHAMLACRVAMRANEVTQIVVEFLPGPEAPSAGVAAPEKIIPLNSWPGELKNR